MPSAHDSVDELLIHEPLLHIEINPSLPCGVDGCGRPTHYGRVEPDPTCDTLWSVLPICEEHQTRLAAAAAKSLADQH